MSWYKVERGWLDNPFFQDREYSERDAWQWMIGEAAYEDCRISVNGKPFQLGKGQLYSSIRFMAQKFQWSTGRVMRFLERLSEWGMVNTAVDTGQNLITICNYAKYQDRKTDVDTPPNTPVDTHSDTATEHQRIQTISPSRNSSPSSVEGATTVAKPPRKKREGERLEVFFQREFPDEHGKPDGEDRCPQEWGEAAQHAALKFAPNTKCDFNKWINWHFNKFYQHFIGSTNANAIKKDWRGAWLNWWKGEFEKISQQESRDELLKQKFTR